MVTRKESTRMFIDGVIEAGQRNIEEAIKRRESTREFINGLIELGQEKQGIAYNLLHQSPAYYT